MPTGGSANVIVIFHGQTTIPAGLTYRKFGPIPPGFGTPLFYTLPGVAFTVGQVGTTSETALMATFTLTDGQLGDGTGLDGMILDPGGPARAASTAQAPAASATGLVAMVLTLCAVAARGLFSFNRKRPE